MLLPILGRRSNLPSISVISSLTINENQMKTLLFKYVVNLRTLKKGQILNPTRKRVNCYVDSDFSGLFSYKEPHYPVCARSQSGYVFTFSKCPTLWVSKIQTEIALSTIHAEYVAISQSLRDLLLFKALDEETLKEIGLNTKKLKVVTKS